MRLETFFQKFDLFADAPDAVVKMRKLVLQLAFSGGLSGHRSNDDGVPDGWERRTIESISASISSGFACSKSHQVANGHVHLRTHNISTLGTLNFDLLVRIDPKMVDPQKASIRAGDILFNNTNSQELVGKTSLVDRDYDYGFSNHITRIRLRDGVLPGFVVFYLTLLRNSGHFARLCTRWINQAAINTDTLKKQTILLPPLAEQKRIVAKVDELMALCDRLEAQQQERETRHAALARASLARFAEAPTPANLEWIFHPSYTIPPADLRKAILTLAVQGKLVPQDPNDEPAEELCDPDDELAEAHTFEVPLGWIWTRLAKLAEINGGFAFKSTAYTEDGMRVVRISDFDEFGFKDHKIVRHPFSPDLQKFALEEQNILMAMTGGTVGKSYLVRMTPEPMIVNQRVATIKITDSALPPYIDIVIRSEMTQEVIRKAKNSTNDNISMGDIKGFAVPLPPLAEQRRIVAKVEQLMALVDALERQLAASRATAEKLLSALVAEITATPPAREPESLPLAAEDAAPYSAAVKS